MLRPTLLSAIETQLRRWATNWLTADWPSCIYRPMGGKAYWDGPVECRGGHK